MTSQFYTGLGRAARNPGSRSERSSGNGKTGEGETSGEPEENESNQSGYSDEKLKELMNAQQMKQQADNLGFDTEQLTTFYEKNKMLIWSTGGFLLLVILFK